MKPAWRETVPLSLIYGPGIYLFKAHGVFSFPELQRSRRAARAGWQCIAGARSQCGTAAGLRPLCFVMLFFSGGYNLFNKAQPFVLEAPAFDGSSK